MRFINLWKLQTLELSPTERIFFRDAISTLQTWDIVKKEYAEFELIKKILEAGINPSPENPSGRKATGRRGNLQNKGCTLHSKKMP